MGHDCLVLLLRLFPVFPLFQIHKKEPAVGVLHDAQQAHADDSRVVFHSGRVCKDLLNLFACRVGTLQRGCIGQGQINEHVSLIFFRQEACGNRLAYTAGNDRDPGKEYKAEDALSDECAR